MTEKLIVATGDLINTGSQCAYMLLIECKNDEPATSR